MRLLMLQLPTSHLGAGEVVYPLGLARLAGLVPPEIAKFTLDMNLCADPWQELKEQLTAINPDLVALSFRNLDPLANIHTSYLPSIITAGRLIRRLCPQSRILAGGPAFSLFARELMQAVPEIDMGLVGEGEQAFARLLDPQQSAGNIPGMIRRLNGRIQMNAPKSLMELHQLPLPDLNSFDPQAYLKGNSYVAAMGIEGKRGCDLKCAYCVYPQLGGARLRMRPPVKIVDEIEYLHNETGADLFHFTDGVVNRPADHFESVCRELCRRKILVHWTGFFREDSLSRKQLQLAQKAGLITVYLSGDALTENGLAMLNKHLTCDDLLRAARLTAESGVLTVCHFLVNLPGETAVDIIQARETLEKILAIHTPAGNLGAVILNNVRLYPQAPLTRKLIKSKLLAPDLNLLYPAYYNPPQNAHVRYELESLCHSAGTFSRLGIDQYHMENSQ